MFDFIKIGPEAGDCTAPYEIILDREYTVKEFVETVLTRDDEWGNIHIGLSLISPHCEYRYGKLLSELPEEYMTKDVISVKARGGWSSMDYYLTVND